MKVLKIFTFFLLVLGVALPGAHLLPGESQTLQRKIKWTQWENKGKNIL